MPHMKPLLSASRLNDFLGCEHQSALWLAGVEPPDTVDATLALLRTKGFEHEAVVLNRLQIEHGPAAIIPGSPSPLDERADTTAKAIADGAALLYQAALRNAKWLGYPDFLVRKAGPDGTPVLAPEDAKLARKPKAEHLLQLGTYAELLHQQFGIPVGSGTLHVVGGPPQSFDLRRTRYILQRLMRRFEAFVGDTARVTRPTPCHACAQCDFKVRCETEWRTDDRSFFVAGVSAAQFVKLEKAGLGSLTELAAYPPGAKVEGMSAEVLAKLGAQARLQLSARETGNHVFELLPVVRGRGFGLLPAPDPHDLFFDMEGDPLMEGGLEYLFGVLGPVGGSSDEDYRAFWAHNSEDEKLAFQSFMRVIVEHFSKYPNAHLYHYAAYEPTSLKRLAMRYATMEAGLDHLLRERRFVDLYRVAVQALRASTESYSLKDLEKIYWAGREGDVATATDSIVEYERWCVIQDAAILDAIALYNKNDCVSTAELRRWLETLRPAGVCYEIIDETTESKRDHSAERAQLEERKQALAERVRASAVGDARIRDLIAELLWFHQRAQKPGWWAVFERQSWSEEELIEDAESLGGLIRDPNVAPVSDKRSLETTFRFPPQDTKLRIGETPKIAETLAGAGTIVDLVPEDGRIVLRRGVKAKPLPDRFSLIPAPINLRDVPEAVFRFGERFASGQLQRDAAILDILNRAPPRLKSRSTGTAILDPGESLIVGAVRAALDLNDSYLFLQGPPGTGKTYTASFVIIALLRAGYRIAVSSNSHKAIHKVLEEVEKHAAEAGFSFCGAKKGNKDEPDTEFDSRHIKTVTDSADVSAAHRLVGGTVFHFSREDQSSAYDYLIVDEAGQVSLGNLVAMAGAARNIILVGDQMQLPQPVQGVHPGETGLSSLEYLLEGKATVPHDRGILLNETRRLHPDLCAFVSEAIYDGRLKSHALTAERYLVLKPNAHDALRPAGLSFVPIEHDGCTQSSVAEAETISALVEDLLKQQIRRANGSIEQLTAKDILVVAPYNLQVNLLRQRLPATVQVGTVDKFQGQEAAVAIVSMTTSRGDDAPRGTQFLFNPNRFNVAVSRAESLAIVVHGTHLLDGTWGRIDDLQRLNLFAHGEIFARSSKA